MPVGSADLYRAMYSSGVRGATSIAWASISGRVEEVGEDRMAAVGGRVASAVTYVDLLVRRRVVWWW